MTGTEMEREFAFSTNFRLSARDWLMVAVVVAAALGTFTLGWSRVETLDFDDEYRIPEGLKDDYWLFTEWSTHAVGDRSVLLMGDSVPWGQFVDSEHTLSACLTKQNEDDVSVANLGVGGLHPVAQAGLLRHHGSAIQDTRALLYWNLVWMRNDKMDLRQAEEFANINHPRLLPQAERSLTCYQAGFDTRCARWMDQHSPLTRLVNHLRMNYFDNMDLQSWVLEHPYQSPLSSITLDVSAPHHANPHAKAEARARARHPEDKRHPLSWTRRLMEGRGYRRKDFPWVPPAESRQWAGFLESVRILQERGNSVFVFIGPLNVDMLDTEENRKVYASIRQAAAKSLDDLHIGRFLIPELASEQFADLSHPLAQGYRLIAEQALRDEAFGRWLRGDG